MYLHPVLPLVDAGLIHGMVHVTGGGVPGNLPRVLPPGVRAVVQRGLRPVPPLFDHLVAGGRVDTEEAWRVFNMGVGFLVVVPQTRGNEAIDWLAATGADSWEIGWIEEGPPGVRWC
jgi:phosphoribosylformylglycinamidine cyclo-ligase